MHHVENRRFRFLLDLLLKDNGVDLRRVFFSLAGGQLLIKILTNLHLIKKYGPGLANGAVVATTGPDDTELAKYMPKLADNERFVFITVEGVVAVWTFYAGWHQIYLHLKLLRLLL